MPQKEKSQIVRIVEDCYEATPAKLAAWNLVCEGYSEEDVLHETTLDYPTRVAVANAIRDLIRKSDPEYTVKLQGLAGRRTH